MTVGELITWLTAEAAALPDGLDTQVLGGVDDDVEQFAGLYADVEIAVHQLPRHGGRAPALWVHGVARTVPAS